MSTLRIINGIVDTPQSLVKYTEESRVDQCGRSELYFTLEGNGIFPVEVLFEGSPDKTAGQAEGYVETNAIFRSPTEDKNIVSIQQKPSDPNNRFIRLNYDLVLNGTHTFHTFVEPTNYAIRPSAKKLAFLQCDNPYSDGGMENFESMVVFSSLAINFLDQDLTIPVNNSSLKYF